jgi:hypothetical protein
LLFLLERNFPGLCDDTTSRPEPFFLSFLPFFIFINISTFCAVSCLYLVPETWRS